MTQLTTTTVSAIVYPDRARIVRQGELSLNAGVHSLEIEKLPLTLNPDSLRVSAHGSAHALLLGAQVKRTYFVETPSDKVGELEDAIEKTQDEIAILDAQVQLIKQNRANLDKLTEQATIFATALAAQEMTVEQHLALFEGLRQQAEKLDHESQVIQINRRGAERRLQKLIKELEQLRNARPRERYTATVEVEVLEPGELTVEASYMVTAAGWKPLYDMRLIEKDGNSTLEIGYLGQVTQNSGETWEQVALTLSTARPALAGTLPELDPWYIRPDEPVIPLMRMAEEPQVAAHLAVKAAPAAARAVSRDLVAEEQVAVVDTTGPAVTYVIPGVTTIPPDGAAHKVTVTRFSLKTRLDYVSAPKLAQAVYRRAKVDNDSPYTLLAGSANIFIADEYIGATTLDLTAPQGEIALYLGNEDRIKVERELKRRDMDKRFIGGKRRIVFGYEIELENLLPDKVNLTLHDQIPVPRHEDIKVKLESADPRPAEQTELNLMKWELSLEPKEKRTVNFDFSVETPQSMAIIGLP